MATSVTIRTSTDPMNGLGFGTDGGLNCPGVGPRGGPYYTTLDNSIAPPEAARTFYYILPTSGNTSYTPPANTALVWPMYVSRPCRITDVISGVLTAGTGSSFCLSMYSNNVTTGAPGPKVGDIARWDTTTTGTKSGVMLSPNLTLGPGNVYWCAAWAYTTSAYPAIQVRTVSNAPSLRLSAAPTAVGFYNGTVVGALSETSVNWSTLLTAPNTISPTQPPTAVTTGVWNTVPQFWWGLYNV